MIETLGHDVRIVDAGEAPADMWCEQPHPTVDDPEGGNAVDVAADMRLYLLTPDGLRTVDVCDDIAQDDLTGADLLPWSSAVNPAKSEAEADIDCAMMGEWLRSLPLVED